MRKDSIKMQHAYDSFIDGFVEFAQEEYDDLQIKKTPNFAPISYGDQFLNNQKKRAGISSWNAFIKDIMLLWQLLAISMENNFLTVM